jgi:large subunit ribosomal protein L17
MRHGKKFNHLGRTKSHRRAMLSNMANSLIEHKRITTTLAKAKALRKYIEPLITKGKDDSTHSRRTVFAYLRSKESIKELFGEIATKMGDRPGGYTRVLKLGTRLGDNAEMAMIEFVDYNEAMLEAKAATGGKAKKSTRRRGGAKKTESTPAAETETTAETIVESDDLTKVETPEATEVKDSSEEA